MKNKIKSLQLILVIMFVLTNCGNAQNKGVEVVKSIDLKKYAGTWYEIARFNHSFEKGLVGVTATYTIRDDGKIEVVNKGYKDSLDGKISIANGIAKVPNVNEPAKLKVSFFLFFFADYNILELDEVDYQYALIGSSSDNYLWILSRTPIMNPYTYQMILDKAKSRGYDISKLIKVKQR